MAESSGVGPCRHAAGAAVVPGGEGNRPLLRLDMALTLAARIAGPQVAQAIQLGIGYDLRPPFDTGSLAKAGPELAGLVPSAGLD